MKRLVTLVAACAAMPLMAATEKVGDYTWTYEIDAGEAEVQGGRLRLRNNRHIPEPERVCLNP